MKNKYVPVEGFSGLVRDMDTNVIHNVDKDSIERARDRFLFKWQLVHVPLKKLVVPFRN
jgi:hypothetical protein